MTRLNWSSRQSPTDLDTPPSKVVDYNFDYRRSTEPGKPSWPERHSNQKFGPSFIRKAWQSGLVVIAEIAELPHHVAAADTRWAAAGVLEVRVQGSWLIPERLYTRNSVKGLKSTGEYIGE